MKIFVASSWKNDYYHRLIEVLRGAGYEVFDYRAQNGFNWSEIDLNFHSWTEQDYRKALSHPLPVSANEVDMKALHECDVCILLHECGKASHFELGHAVGAGKLGIVFLRGNWTVDVIYRNCEVVTSWEELHAALETHKEKLRGECLSCVDETDDPDMCPNARRPCGHHCNCSWENDVCCWCGKVWGEEVQKPQMAPIDMKELLAMERIDRWAAALRIAHWNEDDTLRPWDQFVIETIPPNGDGSEVELWRNVARAALAKLDEES